MRKTCRIWSASDAGGLGPLEIIKVMLSARDPLEAFDPLVREWFSEKFAAVTEPQRLGWPEIQAGRDVLISAPTGSGKTLAAFLTAIDSLVRQARIGELPNRTEILHVSPLQA